MNKSTVLTAVLVSALSLSNVSCTSPKPSQDRPIVILYDNDVHCGIDGYVQMAGLRDAIQAADTAYVAVVSSGDFIQGGTEGTLSKGQYIIDIVNAVGYDAMTLGNHEFDYKIPRLEELVGQLRAPVTCVNYTQVNSDQPVYAPYVIKDFASTRVAFIGVLTPSTLVAESTAFFDDAHHLTHDLHAEDLYPMMQRAIDQARKEGADRVVVLSHLGEVDDPITSRTLIANTTGIDALLDGHTHSVIPCDTVVNRNGEPVLSSQTGTKFANIGKLVIYPNGTITTELLPVSEVQERSERVAQVVDSIKAINAELTQKVCGHSDQLLTINDPEGKRIVRNAETNLADYVADAFRWYGGSDLAFTNGGGVRADLPAGDVTYGNLINVQPFENILCVVRIPGRLLLDVLEIASEEVPNENGAFAQPSGFCYTIDTDSTPRVSNILVMRHNGDYDPIELDREYTLTTTTYNLAQYHGLMLNLPIVKQNIGIDTEAVYQYLVDGLQGHIGPEYAHSQGRITIH